MGAPVAHAGSFPRSRGAVIAAACVLQSFAAATVSPAAAPDSPPASLEGARCLIPQYLDASGVGGGAAYASAADAFEKALAEAARVVGVVKAPYRRAERLHRFLHERFLRRYDPGADGLHVLLTSGRYNCVSAALFYGAAARAVGLPAQIVESPRHLFVRLDLGERTVDIEAVAPDGFDLSDDVKSFVRFALAYKYATPEEVAERGAADLFAEFNRIAAVVDLEEAAAFLWHNTGLRALDRGDGLAAANSLREEYFLRRGRAPSSGDLSPALARAFSIEYEAGRFDNAWWVAYTDVMVFPDQVSPRDRLLAATLKRVEVGCDADDPEGAERALNFAEAALSSPRDRSRLERAATRPIAECAVRVGAFDLARRAAARYAASEPDPVEANRLTRWVEERDKDSRRPGR